MTSRFEKALLTKYHFDFLYRSNKGIAGFHVMNSDHTSTLEERVFDQMVYAMRILFILTLARAALYGRDHIFHTNLLRIQTV